MPALNSIPRVNVASLSTLKIPDEAIIFPKLWLEIVTMRGVPSNPGLQM